MAADEKKKKKTGSEFSSCFFFLFFFLLSVYGRLAGATVTFLPTITTTTITRNYPLTSMGGERACLLTHCIRITAG